jgi:hypothetical protein
MFRARRPNHADPLDHAAAEQAPPATAIHPRFLAILNRTLPVSPNRSLPFSLSPLTGLCLLAPRTRIPTIASVGY